MSRRANKKNRHNLSQRPNKKNLWQAKIDHKKFKEEQEKERIERAKIKEENDKKAAVIDALLAEVTDEEMQTRGFTKILSDGSMFISDWDALITYGETLSPPFESATHRLEVRRDSCNAGLYCKNPIDYEYGSEVPWEERMPNEDYLYLSTHTFYGMSYIGSTEILKACGYNVTINNWDTKRCPL